ncbi:MAG: thioredoxin [Nitrospira sp.]|nr:thioredoxin [Nitrospira sp.]
MRTGLQAITDRQFDHMVEASLVPVLVEFWKPDCGHCQALAIELEQVQEEFGLNLLVLTMNVEENPQIPAELSITSLPALAFYRNGHFQTFIGGIGKRDDIVKQVKRELSLMVDEISGRCS